ncbi:MAG: tRNA uridine-5-carboxymethylaminomethyl(34) synthesis GTPase MnmE [Gammaproteobacteria bacterium]|nr:tRNA uridine-5-carboxymethylaminomethyl(34) synthesis GTPase MnmE [Gammaproteobacteria bacterium]
MRFRKFLDASGQTIDHGLCFYCQAPHSFSGEDVVEIQGHGGPILLDMLLERICELGARLARAGEFSERAFLNGKLDLAQAEAIADLIESGSRAAAKAAMRSLEGLFSSQVHQLVDEIINLRAFVEAALDFAEEEIDFLADPTIDGRLLTSLEKLQDILLQAENGRVLNEGLTVALAGLPNAGKSSLLNYLAGYEAAIVTEIAGTTRDVVREHISLKGIPLRINDTAGLRSSDHPVEQEGIKRAWREIDKADTILLLVDANFGMTVADREIIKRFGPSNYHLIYSKADLLPASASRDPQAHYISTRSGEGMDQLIDLITDNFSDYNQDNATIMARRRHVDALLRARECLQQAQRIFTETQSGELMAEDLRQAQQHLSEITGEYTSDDLLGKIFSSFCIGK